MKGTIHRKIKWRSLREAAGAGNSMFYCRMRDGKVAFREAGDNFDSLSQCCKASMNSIIYRRRAAFTRIELVVVIFILAILFWDIESMTATTGAKRRAQRISCINNLKQIGTAYRLWADDHGGRAPASQSMSNGGWSEFLANPGQGANCWTNYAILADHLGLSPKLVICPSDDRIAAREFGCYAKANNLRTDCFQNNSNLSYFVGVSADTKWPRSLLSGDRNLGGGLQPDSEFGYSPTNGSGNDIALPITGPAAWSLKMHSSDKPAGAGNILMGDGSAQQVPAPVSTRLGCAMQPPQQIGPPVAFQQPNPSAWFFHNCKSLIVGPLEIDSKGFVDRA